MILMRTYPLNYLFSEILSMSIWSLTLCTLVQTYQQLDKQSPEESTNFKKNASAEKREPNSKATDSMSSTHSKQAASNSITHSNQATLESIGNLKKVESPV